MTTATVVCEKCKQEVPESQSVSIWKGNKVAVICGKCYDK